MRKKYFIHRKCDSACVLYYLRQLLTTLHDHDRTIIPLCVLAQVSFCCAQKKKWTDDKDI